LNSFEAPLDIDGLIWFDKKFDAKKYRWLRLWAVRGGGDTCGGKEKERNKSKLRYWYFV
jgi:hypothetical protein